MKPGFYTSFLSIETGKALKGFSRDRNHYLPAKNLLETCSRRSIHIFTSRKKENARYPGTNSCSNLSRHNFHRRGFMVTRKRESKMSSMNNPVAKTSSSQKRLGRRRDGKTASYESHAKQIRCCEEETRVPRNKQRINAEDRAR